MGIDNATVLITGANSCLALGFAREGFARGARSRTVGVNAGRAGAPVAPAAAV